jgi:HlyD family secretion protein
MSGVLQEVAVAVGERVARGARLARVADPTRLEAELRIPEAQTQDVRVGLPVVVDTYNGLVEGVVRRIAPAAQNGTVTVDVRLDGPLPRGARPDMTVDGVIQLERLDEVLHVGRPTGARANSEVTLFKLSADESSAQRRLVQIGRTSATEVEMVAGLVEGDRVVLSEVGAWLDHEVVRLK